MSFGTFFEGFFKVVMLKWRRIYKRAKAYSVVQAELKKYRLVVYCQGSKDFIM
jgi:hypothetical protein